jgi:hypothetical protein
VSDEDTKDKDFWTDLNRRLSTKWPNINRSKDPLVDADLWKDQENKIHLLEE